MLVNQISGRGFGVATTFARCLKILGPGAGELCHRQLLEREIEIDQRFENLWRAGREKIVGVDISLDYLFIVSAAGITLRTDALQ